MTWTRSFAGRCFAGSRRNLALVVATVSSLALMTSCAEPQDDVVESLTASPDAPRSPTTATTSAVSVPPTSGLVSTSSTSPVERSSPATTTPDTNATPAPVSATVPTASSIDPASTDPIAAVTVDASGSPFDGLGTWLDVYEWSPSQTNGRPKATPEDVEEMATVGVDTLYIQTTLTSAASDITDEDVLRSFIAEARRFDIAVVPWFLPTHVNPERDLRRLLAIAALEPDGIGVDIEGTSIDDVAERNRRLVQMSKDLRAAVGPDMAIAAIVLSPIGLVTFKPTYWPDFPWRDLAPLYDVWMPMGYWTFRRDETPEWDDADRYTNANFDLLVELTGQPNPKVHTIGGLSEDMTPGQAADMVDAIVSHGGIGGSLYSWPGTDTDEWAALRPLSQRLQGSG